MDEEPTRTPDWSFDHRESVVLQGFKGQPQRGRDRLETNGSPIPGEVEMSDGHALRPGQTDEDRTDRLTVLHVGAGHPCGLPN